jgi:RNA polymerase sigma-70 factor (ECF subfamily)
LARIDASTLFHAHATFVAAFLTRLGVGRQELDDAVQEVFLVAHRRGGYVEGPAQPTTWLAEIAVRVVATLRRTRRRRPEGEPVSPAEEPATSRTPFDAMADAESLERVGRALETLSLEHRSVFVLFEIHGEPCDSIAAAFGLPVGTVYSRLHAARRGFLRAYQQLTPTEVA